MTQAMWYGAALMCALCVSVQAAEPAAMTYARKQMAEAKQDNVEFREVQGLGHDEAFRIVKQDGTITVEYQTAAGALYGAQAAIRDEYESGRIEKPDFLIRGTTLPNTAMASAWSMRCWMRSNATTAVFSTGNSMRGASSRPCAGASGKPSVSAVKGLSCSSI